MSGDAIELTGEVLEEQRGGFFRVAVGAPLAREVLCRLCGKMAKHRIRVLPGDRVTIEVSPYAIGTSGAVRGRITYRGARPQGAA